MFAVTRALLHRPLGRLPRPAIALGAVFFGFSLGSCADRLGPPHLPLLARLPGPAVPLDGDRGERLGPGRGLAGRSWGAPSACWDFRREPRLSLAEQAGRKSGRRALQGHPNSSSRDARSILRRSCGASVSRLASEPQKLREVSFCGGQRARLRGPGSGATLPEAQAQASAPPGLAQASRRSPGEWHRTLDPTGALPPSPRQLIEIPPWIARPHARTWAPASLPEPSPRRSSRSASSPPSSTSPSRPG